MANNIENLSRTDLKKEVELGKKTRSYEYSSFVKEKVERKTWYEVACKRAGKILKLGLSTRERIELEHQIISADLNIKPYEVMSLSILALIASMAISVLVILFSDSLFSFALLPASFFLYTYLKGYPNSIAKKIIMDETSEMVLGVLYLVIYMRHTPNIESAIKFASNNLSGQLGNDFKLILWNVQTKKSKDIFEALNEFLEKWNVLNKPFVDSMYLIISALHQINPEKRMETLDTAVDTMLDGTYEGMVRFANKLKTPVQAVSLLGITLPILGLVMLPMISAFLSDLITSEMIFVLYDIILPVVVFFAINRVLTQRPVGFSLPDVSKHPDLPPKNTFLLTIGKEKRPVSVFIIPIVFLVLGVVTYILYVLSVQGAGPSRNDVFGSLTIIIGITLSLVSYFYLNSFQKIKLRENIGSVESDFTNAAYILSNLLSEGKPIETALIKTAKEMKSSNIHDFFDKIVLNIKQLGMSVESAIFDTKEGAIKLYPSMLVRSIMRILISTSGESTEAASMSMSNIGRYTKSIHKIDEKIKDILSETISSVSFQANFIAPLITGVVVGLSTMIFLILHNLGSQIGSLSGTDVGGASGMNIDFIISFLNIESAVDIWAFQPIVGLYLILVVTLMVYLINKIEYSGDTVYFMHKAGRTLLTSIIVYVIIVTITTVIFTFLSDVAITVGAV